MSLGLSDDPILRRAPEIDGYKVLGPCLLQAKIGQGGMGAVYRGYHVNLGIEVAVKCLLPPLAALGDEIVTRFQREAHLAARVTHQNLVRVYDIGREHGIHFLVLELVRGETLGDRMARKGSAPVAEAFQIFLQAARGIAAAHAEQVVHRDLKPANVMVSTRGIVKVADLGLGRLAESDASMTAAFVRMGTPAFMPPEQWRSFALVGPEGDVWALGATVYSLLAGRPPFQGTLHEIERRICEEPFPDPCELDREMPKSLAETIRRSTSRTPEDRYRDARELVMELERIALDEPFANAPTALEAIDASDALSPTRTYSDALAPPSFGVIEKAKRLGARSEREVRSAKRARHASREQEREHRPTRRWPIGIVALLALVAILLVSLGFPWSRRDSAEPSSVTGATGAGDDSPTGAHLADEPRVRAIPGFRFLRTSPQGLAEYEHERSGIAMVLIEGGTFKMGSGAGDPDARDDEKPSHTVVVSPFLIGKHEVSQAEWERAGEQVIAEPVDRGPRLPAVNVSWEDARRFCENVGLRLPAEAEWEVACRAGTASRYAFGDRITPDLANFLTGDELRKLRPVDELEPNAFGLFQMHGNVWEWCEDAYDPNCYAVRASEAARTGVAAKDPLCTKGDHRVLRGGGFAFPPEDCRSAARWADEPSVREPSFGFRVACSLGD